MDFEEQFPSLIEANREADFEGDGIIPDHVLMKHCLDKQRVKEAILKRLEPVPAYDVLKELGLEK